MAAIRRLEQIEKESKQTPSNRNFGVLQEVRADSRGAVLAPSQGLSGVSAVATTQPAFSILRDEETEERERRSDVPWTKIDAFSAQSKENERLGSGLVEVKACRRGGMMSDCDKSRDR